MPKLIAPASQTSLSIRPRLSPARLSRRKLCRGHLSLKSLILLHLRPEPVRGDGLGPLEGQAEGAIPVQLAQSPDGAAHPEQDCVVLELRESVMPQEHATVRINVRVGVRHLPVLGKDARHDLIDGIHDLEELIIGKVLKGKFPLARVPRVGLAQDGVAIARNDLLGIERLPGEFRDGLSVHLLPLSSEPVRQGLDPLEDLLIGEAVEGSGEGVESRGVRQVRIGERRADEVGGVSRGISALVIRVDAQVQPHELVEGRVVVSKHAAEVARIVEGVVLVHDAVEVDVAVDHRSNLRDLGDYVEDILERVFVVVRLGHAIGVGLGEFGFGLARVEADGELGHGVHVLGEAVEEGHDVGGKVRAFVQLDREGVHLLLGGDLGREEEPEETLHEGLAVAGLAGERRQDGLAFGDGQSAEANALLRVQIGRFPQHALDAPGTANDLIDCHLPDTAH
mmetsp:Transcript_39562/g.118728  ORF Transcript_39562/g.118728 Transcript_39562/m.118728 type:complete len:452 (-) Transcript_39562:129-1484(-)